MSGLHLIYQRKYNCGFATMPQFNNNNNENTNNTLKFGDDAVDGNVMFKYNKTKSILTLGIDLTWNTHLMNYYQNQVVGIKCVVYQRYPQIKSESTFFDGILKKNDNIISLTKQFPVTQLYSNISFDITLSIPAMKDLEYVPTIQEIKQEIAKLSEEEIQKERQQYNEYLKSGDPWIIYESLEEKIANHLIEKKKKENSNNNNLKPKILTKNFVNEIKNDFSDF